MKITVGQATLSMKYHLRRHLISSNKDMEPEIETATQVNKIQTEDVQQKTTANDEDVSMQSTMVIVQSIMTGDVQTELETDTQFLEN
ncbi:hypothetical protein L6452_34351 [Arctium lappa]|uniref:Uncharacterized protein n=1 Tax=Arctium lappa TaxID=4217 RepID=A0ACB8YHC5_ARCLA|nr:hypothetical protein L6452_34351 [Arctium lappa]